MTLVAKPIIDKQFWVVHQDNRKVGNIEAVDGGYQIKIDNQIIGQYKNIKLVKDIVEFEPVIPVAKKKATTNEVYGYSISGRAHNPMWYVQKQLPVYTKTKKSKSWYAAGWYYVKKGRAWSTMRDPKLITLQRYPYQGPYHTKEEVVKQ